MTFLFVLQSVLIVFAFAEIVLVNYPQIQRQLYVIAFIFTAIWCTAKYAYGPDVCIYVPYYRLMTTDIWYNLTHAIHDYHYEKGFVLFCSICKKMNLSFWGMTAVISVAYFTTIAFVFRNLKSYRIIALLVLVFLDNNLILVELRQCLAVIFFYIAIMTFNKKQYVWSAIAVLTMLSMHKTAFVVLFFAVIFYLSRGLKVEAKSYFLLALLIIGFIMIPLLPMMSKFVGLLPLPESYIYSAQQHLLVGRGLQKILLLYFSTILVLAWYKQGETDNKTRHWVMWCCVAVLALLFPYWFLLNRFRSYFIPFLIIYTIDTICVANVRELLPRQLYTVLVLGYIIVSTALISQTNKTLKYPTDRISLVFERVNHTEEELLERQLKQAIKYWEYDYNQLLKNGQSK